jgi:hypothetical protein
MSNLKVTTYIRTRQQRIMITILSACFFFSPIIGQETKSDTLRFYQDSINGVYIPRDLNDCFTQLDGFFNDSTKSKISEMPEQEFSTISHFGLGLWIRNNWQLWGGSRLSRYFNKLGIFHPDDMSGIILTSYNRYLLKSDIRLNEQIQDYKDFWEKSKMEEKEQNKEFNEYEIGDTVLYNYLSGFATKNQERNFIKEKCIAKGIVIERDKTKSLLKVRLIESCGGKGIIYFDSDNTLVYNDKTKKLEKPIKREILYLKKGMENWFNYLNWETIE